jgi:hypothetical protein
MFALLAYVCWRLRVRYYGDLSSLLAFSAVGFGILAGGCVLFDRGLVSARIVAAATGVLLLLGLLRPDEFPYARAALIGSAALFAIAYAWPSSPCPVCLHRRCRCYAKCALPRGKIRL